MIDTLEQFERGEEAIAKMTRFLLVAWRPHTHSSRRIGLRVSRPLSDVTVTPPPRG
jgi:hypothetical protein